MPLFLMNDLRFISVDLIFKYIMKCLKLFHLARSIHAAIKAGFF